MIAQRKRFERLTGTRPLRKVFVIATEGNKTEPQYFDCFKHVEGITIKILPSRDDSSPEAVLRKLQNHLLSEKYDRPFEAWLVVDKDRWSKEQLDELFRWSREKPDSYHLAVSNPKFEYWLLLHFENGNGVSSSKQCDLRLKKYLEDYSKNCLDIQKIQPGISNAIRRAESKDRPPCEKWPEKTGTTVYLLVKKLHQD